MSVRESFVERFGEDQAVRVELAAQEHGNGINSGNKGSDEFKWACLIAIGYECVTRPSFRDYHKITFSPEDFKQWAIEKGEFGTHDGDCDYLSLVCGEYNDYVKAKESAV